MSWHPCCGAVMCPVLLSNAASGAGEGYLVESALLEGHDLSGSLLFLPLALLLTTPSK